MKRQRILYPVETVWSLSIERSVDSRGVFRLAICITTPVGRKLCEFRTVPTLDERDDAICAALVRILDETEWYERPDILRVDEAALQERFEACHALAGLVIEREPMVRVSARNGKAFEKHCKENPRYDRRSVS